MPPKRENTPTLPTPGRPRLARLDALRGLAVIAMIGFHFSWDLNRFAGDLRLIPAAWLKFGNFPIATAFFLILGISASLRVRAHPGRDPSTLFRQRGLTLFALGLFTTALTWLISPALTIWFGVLHCIGICLLLFPFFLRRPRLIRPAAVAMVLTGLALRPARFDFHALLWLGFRPVEGAGTDWYPLLPWLGVALLGLSLGKRAESWLDRPAARQPSLALRTMAWVGRHSLAIYLVHQPIALGILYALGIAHGKMR